jgi:hypothetical protein
MSETHHTPVSVSVLAVGDDQNDSHAISISGLTLGDAERLLDWLENHNCTKIELESGADGFIVRWTGLDSDRSLNDAGQWDRHR